MECSMDRQEFGIYGAFSSKDLAAAVKLVLAGAQSVGQSGSPASGRPISQTSARSPTRPLVRPSVRLASRQASRLPDCRAGPGWAESARSGDRPVGREGMQGRARQHARMRNSHTHARTSTLLCW